MRRALPPHTGRVVLACSIVLFASAQAFAYELQIERPFERTGTVWANVRLDDPFDARVEESLMRGVPATLQIRVELWRKRTAWFDKLERTFEGSIRIRYEVWRDRFVLQRTGSSALTFGSLDSVRAALAEPIGVPITSISHVRAGPEYYVVASTTLRPLSAEDVEELEEWLQGGGSSGGSSSLDLITAIPRAIFDAVRNVAGFGDQRARAVSDGFDLATLLGTRTPLPATR